MFGYVGISIPLQTDPHVKKTLNDLLPSIIINLKDNPNVDPSKILTCFGTPIDGQTPKVCYIYFLKNSHFFEADNEISFRFGQFSTTAITSDTISSKSEDTVFLLDNSDGKSKSPLLLQLCFFPSYLPPNLAANSFDMFSNSSRLFLVGHRGSGSSFGCTNPFTDIDENTVASFNLCHQEGADMAELDVSITADGEVVVYHDDTVLLDDKITEISQLVYSDIIRTQNVRHDTKALLKVGQGDKDHMELLTTVLTNTPSTLALDVEIKFPPSVVVSRNYVQPIIDVLQAHPNRGFFISSFSPIICIIASRIQADIPVFLLMDKDDDVSEALSGIEGENVWGVVVNAEIALDGRNLKECFGNKKVFVWGDKNNDPENIKQLVGLGVDGIIADRVDLLVKYGSSN